MRTLLPTLCLALLLIASNQLAAQERPHARPDTTSIVKSSPRTIVGFLRQYIGEELYIRQGPTGKLVEVTDEYLFCVQKGTDYFIVPLYEISIVEHRQDQPLTIQIRSKQ